MGITSKISNLNQSDLSKLSRRISDLKKQAESITVTAHTGSSNTDSSLTAAQLIEELAHAKRSAS